MGDSGTSWYRMAKRLIGVFLFRALTECKARVQTMYELQASSDTLGWAGHWFCWYSAQSSVEKALIGPEKEARTRPMPRWTRRGSKSLFPFGFISCECFPRVSGERGLRMFGGLIYLSEPGDLSDNRVGLDFAHGSRLEATFVCHPTFEFLATRQFSEGSRVRFEAFAVGVVRGFF